ncbi:MULTISPECIES: GGDEF domain-containing phosphodiesterase [Pseudoalteromonas]|jgi:EAL domain-containing protein (putative c-di-GMP-specific phosphodiesterase class I)/GGDEF domain-containing protein|uniref:EAL domain-containing protein n=2 Tax=Pseudoalteromonas TaxID=53246 RepID=A0AB39AUN1_9GAMM|nr:MULTISPECIES: GGDEF domain-containing phosphodiesterase [Pseudoalteromonas]MAY59071.1 GGDEF domain-containing protein [Pseudoalteromonas sp.]KYL35289.1 diguanylate phosphodiesterase [Pseudoalteromonas spiralis]MDN3395078.1 GGDEF domain-containing phosphodiesterase [Pseudoalteromonas sp. APC 3215]MDN3401045.1 GGDEF domain-containing phosphodiesterase [Pseudoalteromonas sp. APC 3213]MDN3405040.1 GGDEF domain-containing phosphodiesterase [Pseudoalteromonas sp. APC 3218]|tara:strand:+ start:9987 stop:11711 length:1725 start_codon:yes stop_codon:yes gene_type:complete
MDGTLLSYSNLAIFLSGALLMAMVATLLTVKSNVMRLSFLCTGLIGLAMVSSAIPWLAILLALGFGFNLYQAKLQKQKKPFLISACASALFALLLIGYLFFTLHLAWLLMAILLLSVSGFLADNEPKATTPLKPQTEPEVYVENSPLVSFPDKQQLRQKYNELIDEGSFRAALIVLRLEGFAQVNQHIGRDFGDLLLSQSANRIKDLLDSDEVLFLAPHAKLAHLGGLNFAFICDLQSHNHLHQQLIKQIIGATLKPFNVANCTIEVKVRASYVHCDQQSTSFDDLISYAYLALDSQPSKQIVAYHQQMTVEHLEQQARLTELANISFADEFELFFQPVIRNGDGQIEFLELLLRWQHPTQGTLSASRFINDIRIAGLGYSLATFVIERAGELAMALRMEGMSVPLSVNLFGPEMLNEEFVDFVYGVIGEHQLRPGDLIIECPLHVFTSLDDKGRAMIARLNSLGLKVCVDGLGDNPVLLSKLPSLAVEYIKVSPALTADFSNQNNIRSLVSGMVEMHNQQQTKVIFEGVETLDQLKFVKSLKAYASQGYYFGHPLSSLGLMSWFKQWLQAQED